MNLTIQMWMAITTVTNNSTRYSNCFQLDNHLSLLTSLSDSMAHASTMVSSSAPSVYSVQALVLLAEVEFISVDD